MTESLNPTIYENIESLNKNFKVYERQNSKNVVEINYLKKKVEILESENKYLENYNKDLLNRVHVLEKLLKEERTKNIAQVATQISKEKFNYVQNDLKERGVEVRRLVEQLESVPSQAVPNFRQDIQEYFTSLNLQELLLKEYEAKVSPAVIDRLEKHVTAGFRFEEENEGEGENSAVAKVHEAKGYVGSIYTADCIHEKYLLAGGTDCTLQVYNLRKCKSGEATANPEFILRLFKDEIFYVAEAGGMVYVIDIRLTLYAFASSSISSYSDKTGGTGYLNPTIATFNLVPELGARAENTYFFSDKSRFVYCCNASKLYYFIVHNGNLEVEAIPLKNSLEILTMSYQPAAQTLWCNFIDADSHNNVFVSYQLASDQTLQERTSFSFNSKEDFIIKVVALEQGPLLGQSETNLYLLRPDNTSRTLMKNSEAIIEVGLFDKGADQLLVVFFMYSVRVFNLFRPKNSQEGDLAFSLLSEHVRENNLFAKMLTMQYPYIQPYINEEGRLCTISWSSENFDYNEIVGDN